MTDGPIVVVSAIDHPTCDAWVIDQAREEAGRNGLAIRQYLGREDALPDPRQPDLCCHVFTARPVDAAGTEGL